MVTRRYLLAFAVSIGVLLGGFGFFGILFFSLKPTEAIISSHKFEVDLSALRPGEVLRFDWEGQEILVVRRTPEQIEWLEHYDPPPAQGLVAGERSNSKVVNRFRSLRKDYLVVAAERYRENLRLREISQYSLCDELAYDANRHALKQGVTFHGVLYCSRWYGRPIDDPLNSMFVYDIAGRNRNPWVAPLEIPSHYFQGEKTLVLDASS